MVELGAKDHSTGRYFGFQIIWPLLVEQSGTSNVLFLWVWLLRMTILHPINGAWEP